MIPVLKFHDKNKKEARPRTSLTIMPSAGLEPARYHYRGILSPLRLPISSRGRLIILSKKSLLV